MTNHYDSLANFTQALAVPSGFQDTPFASAYSKDWGRLHQDLYRSSWIARAAIDSIPEDCFKRGYQWVADPTQIAALERVEKTHRIQKKKQQAMSFSRLDGEAYIYMDVRQGSASSELNVNAVNINALRFINVLRANDLTKAEVVKDPLSQYYGQPSYYRINSGDGQNTRIHPSRIIRFVTAPDPESGNGQSVLNFLAKPIMAAETARDNTVALTTEALIDVMKVCGLMDAVADPETRAQFVQRYQLVRQMKATNRMMVIDMESEDFDRKPSTFNTLPDVIETMRREVAAAIGVPYSILFGRPGGLGTNGETELKAYYDNIATMQRNEIQPVCEPLDEVVIRSALGSRPEEIYIDWASLWEMSDTEKATVAKTYADAAKTAIDSGAIPADIMTESLINAWVELGAFQGVEQEYADWVAGGGELEPPADESNAVNRGGDLPEDDE